MDNDEKEFITKRLQIIEDKLGRPSQFDIDDKGGFHLRIEVSPTVEYALIREARILEKLNNEVKEGKIQVALVSWRKFLSQEFRKHKEFFSQMQEAYDEWLKYPWPTRINIPEPPQPPNCEVLDKDGYTWVVDGQLIKVFDDVIERLDKWTSTND